MTETGPRLPTGGDNQTPRSSELRLFVSFAVFVFLLYAPVLRQPFVQDEYEWLARLADGRYLHLLGDLFNPVGRLFYRPLSGAYYIVFYQLAGLHTIAWRVSGLLWLTACVWLAYRLVREVTGDRFTAASAALLFAASTSILMDAVSWFVGLNELGSLAFTLLAILAFRRDRHFAAASLALVAMLFKESAAFVPLLLGLWYLSRRPPLSKWKPLAGYAACAVAFAMTKLVSHAPTQFAAEDPYAVRLSAHVIVSNLQDYAVWLVNTLTLHTAQSRLSGALAIGWVLALMLAARAPALAAWLSLSFLPFLFFPNHVYRYYLIAALVPFLTCILLALRNARAPRWALAALVIGNAVAGGVYFHRRMAEGTGQAFIEGTNWLGRKGAMVSLTRDALLADLPHPPTNAVLVFSGLEPWAFAYNRGLRIWYGRTDLRACAFEQVQMDRRGPFLVVNDKLPHPVALESVNARKLHFEPAQARLYVLENGRLVNRTDLWRQYWDRDKVSL